jgi:SNF2 family DNA or RNA helicase
MKAAGSHWLSTSRLLHGPERKSSFDQIDRHDIVITTYPLLHRDGDVLFAQSYDTVILDEAQIVKNPASRAAKLIRDVQARQRLALTGTPIENNLEELWSLFDWLIPGLLGNRKTFGQHFRKPIEKEGDRTAQARLNSNRAIGTACLSLEL